MPRKEIGSPAKRRPTPGPAGKGGNASANGPRSPPRPSRTSPTSTRSGGTSTGSTFIAPPPRAALSGTSSPSPDHPRNNTAATSTKPPSAASPRLAPSSGPGPGRDNRRREPSPSPATIAAATATATASAGSYQTGVLHDKDARIAALERELALMESEFVRELDKLSRAESDTAAFWQGKCAALEAEVAVLVGGLREHAGGAGAGAGAGISREGPREGPGEGCASREGIDRQMGEDGDGERMEWERAKDVLDGKEREIAELKAQVRGLKEWVSMSTRADGEAQTSDEVFGAAMARLGNGLQNWVLVNFRRARIDLSGADEDSISELARLVPMYEELATASRIHLLQSVVSRLLVELVFDAYFVGLPPDVAAQLKQVEAFLSSASSPESINQWRSLTLTMLKKDAGEKLQPETSTVIDAFVAKVNNLLDSITNTKSSAARDQGLQALVASAIELSRLLAVQKAVFRVEMPQILPHQRTMFDGETMEDIGGEDEDGLADRDICCVTFPGIVKRGDECGSHLQYRNVISKAKVLCSPE